MNKELIDKYVYYDNALRWKEKNRHHEAGDLVQGYISNDGIRQFKIKDTAYSFSKVVYYLHYRIYPQQMVYLDGNVSNCNIENLQPTTIRLMTWGKRKYKNGACDYKGITYEPSRRKYKAKVTKNGVHYYIGRYDTQEEAAKAYNVKALELFGKFARLNEVN